MSTGLTSIQTIGMICGIAALFLYGFAFYRQWSSYWSVSAEWSTIQPSIPAFVGITIGAAILLLLCLALYFPPLSDKYIEYVALAISSLAFTCAYLSMGVTLISKA